MGEKKSHISGTSVILPLTSLPIPACIRQQRISCTKSTEQTLYPQTRRLLRREVIILLFLFFIEVPKVNLFS